MQHRDVIEVAAHGVKAVELESEDEIKLCIVSARACPRARRTLLVSSTIERRTSWFHGTSSSSASSPHTMNGKIHKANLRQHPISERTWDARAAGYEVIKD